MFSIRHSLCTHRQYQCYFSIFFQVASSPDSIFVHPIPPDCLSRNHFRNSSLKRVYRPEDSDKSFYFICRFHAGFVPNVPIIATNATNGIVALWELVTSSSPICTEGLGVFNIDLTLSGAINWGWACTWGFGMKVELPMSVLILPAVRAGAWGRCQSSRRWGRRPSLATRWTPPSRHGQGSGSAAAKGSHLL